MLETLAAARTELEEIVADMPESAWTAPVYENGWNAKQLLCHIASTSGVAGFVLTLAASPSGAGGGGAGSYNVDDFNRQQVAARQEKTVSELLSEAQSTFERDNALIGQTEEGVFGRRFRAPWGIEGSVADVIVGSVRDHLEAHMSDLRAAAKAA